MAVIASIAACYVGQIFSGRDYAIVTRATSTNDLSVINRNDGRPHV